MNMRVDSGAAAYPHYLPSDLPATVVATPQQKAVDAAVKNYQMMVANGENGAVVNNARAQVVSSVQAEIKSEIPGLRAPSTSNTIPDTQLALHLTTRLLAIDNGRYGSRTRCNDEGDAGRDQHRVSKRRCGEVAVATPYRCARSGLCSAAVVIGRGTLGPHPVAISAIESRSHDSDSRLGDDPLGRLSSDSVHATTEGDRVEHKAEQDKKGGAHDDEHAGKTTPLAPSCPVERRCGHAKTCPGE